MKRIKSIFIVVAVLCILLAIAACSKSGSSEVTASESEGRSPLTTAGSGEKVAETKSGSGENTPETAQSSEKPVTLSTTEHVHSEAVDPEVPATCTRTGLTEGKHCSVCGLVLVKQESIPAVGHNYVNYVCTLCGDEIKVSKGLVFTNKGIGTCYVSGIGTCKDTDVIIPSTSPDGDTVTSIANNAFYECSSVTSVTIPDSVTFIGKSAFESCTSLASVKIGKSVTNICDWAFNGCTDLTSITIPGSVTAIGYLALSECSSLASINVDDNNPNYCSIDGNLYSKDTTKLIQYAIGKTDTTFTVPDGVTAIGESAFRNCTNLTSVTIQSSVTAIERVAFYGCNNLTNASFKKTEGWYISREPNATSGSTISAYIFVDYPSVIAEYLISDNCDFYWYRK